MGRKRGSVADGLDMFARTYGITKGVMNDMDTAEVNALKKEKMESAQAEADASGKPAYTVTAKDTGTDVYANAADRDSAAETARTIQEMEAMPAAASGIAQESQAIKAPPIARQGLSLNAPLANASMANDTMSRMPAPDTTAQPVAEVGGVTTSDASTPKLSAMDIFHKKYAPTIAAKLVSQGREKDAAAFTDWSRSEKGKSYGETWSKAMMTPESDPSGRVNAMVDLYNKQLPDGQYAVANQGEDGKYSVQIHDEKTHRLLGGHTASADDVFKIGAGMLSPEKQYGNLLAMESKKADLAADVAKDYRKDSREEKRLSNQLTLQEMKDASKAMSDDKRFNAMLQAAEARSSRGELGRKPTTQVAAEWLIEKGIAKTPEEAWQKANQLGEAVNEKVSTDSYGNTTVHNPQTGEIVRMDGEGKKTVIRAATKGIDKRPIAVTPHQEYVEAWNRAKGNPELQSKITARARQNGVAK